VTEFYSSISVILETVIEKLGENLDFHLNFIEASIFIASIQDKQLEEDSSPLL
jgi:hypothetical protein